MQTKWALKALGMFFAAMIVLTLIARAGDSLMIANVQAEHAARGALSHEARAEAAVEALDVQMIWGQSGLRVARVLVTSGAKVAKGDPLIEFDLSSVMEKADEAQLALEKLINERAQLELDAPDGKDVKAVKMYKLKLDAINMSMEGAKKTASDYQAIRADGARLMAPIDGCITTVNIQAGVETSSEALMQLPDPNGGIYLYCRITHDEAKYVAVGDAAEVTPLGKTQFVRARVASVSQPDQKGQVEVMVLLPEDAFAIGTYCSVGFTRVTEGYQAVIPLSALRSERTGDYVLVLRSKKSVLGDGEVAERMPVTVHDRDAKRAAISGALLDGDLVISGWDRPVKAGDRVRRGMP